jgi:hypothetical protein
MQEVLAEDSFSHTRGVKQAGTAINNIANTVNSVISAVTLGTVKPTSGVVLGNGTATANLNVVVTGPFNKNNTDSFAGSAGLTCAPGPPYLCFSSELAIPRQCPRILVEPFHEKALFVSPIQSI